MSAYRPAALAAVIVLAGTAPPATADLPGWFERLLFNPAERTERAGEALAAGEAGAAIGAAETARRLATEVPPASYNAGTARLFGGDNGAALPLLEEAATTAAPELRSLASYNLGNAKLAAGDLPGAIEGFKSALRSDPSLAEAKFNLELAQKLLGEQQQEQQDQQQQQDQEQQDQQDQEQQQDPQEQGEQDGEQPQDPQESEGEDPQEEPQREDAETEDPGEQQEGSQPPPQPDPQGSQQDEQPLPQFRDLPDMSAEEAAAILEAVENMEREELRQQALEAAAEAATGDKDW